MLRNAAKAMDLPMQLKKAKELLASLQGQLVKAQQSTLKRVVVEGVASMQGEVANIQELTTKLRECQKEVDSLTREMKMGNSPQDGKGGKRSATDGSSEKASSFGSSLIDEIIKPQSILNVASGPNGVSLPDSSKDALKSQKKKKWKRSEEHTSELQSL